MDDNSGPVNFEGNNFRQLQDLSAESNVCKACIDSLKTWCPDSNFANGYCCTDVSTCPRNGKCSSDYNDIQVKYSLCPDENSCRLPRTMAPTLDGQSFTYSNKAHLMQLGELCTFKISNPASSDFNDIMYIKFENLTDVDAYLLKGSERSAI